MLYTGYNCGVIRKGWTKIVVKVDLQLWERKEIFDFFSDMSQPFYSVTFTVDVTELYKYVKVRGLSFYYALVYLCTEAVNETDAFLYMMKDGEVYKIDRRFDLFYMPSLGGADCSYK